MRAAGSNIFAPLRLRETANSPRRSRWFRNPSHPPVGRRPCDNRPRRLAPRKRSWPKGFVTSADTGTHNLWATVDRLFGRTPELAERCNGFSAACGLDSEAPQLRDERRLLIGTRVEGRKAGSRLRAGQARLLSNDNGIWRSGTSRPTAGRAVPSNAAVVRRHNRFAFGRRGVKTDGAALSVAFLNSRTASAVAAPRLGYYLRCLALRQRQCASEASPRPCRRRGAGAVRCLRDERKNASTTIENGLQPNYACSGRCMASQHCRFAILEELVLSGGSPICTNASVAASKP